MMSLSQIENDKRISSIERLSPEESDYKYYVWLNDGWICDDGSHLICADSVSDINQQLKFVTEE